MSYRTSDNRWLVLCFPREDRDWPVFAKAIGRADLLGDTRFANSESRHANSSALVAELDRVFGAQPLAHWKTLLDAANLAYGVVQIPEEIVKDPQLLENQIIVPIDDGSANRRYTVNSPVTMKESPKIAPRIAPGLGEHTDQILQELGFKASQIEGFRASGAVAHVGG